MSDFVDDTIASVGVKRGRGVSDVGDEFDRNVRPKVDRIVNDLSTWPRFYRAVRSAPVVSHLKMAKRKRSGRSYVRRRRKAYKSSALIDPEQRRNYLALKAYDPSWSRGGANSLNEFGPTWAMATIAQRNARMRAGFHGRGDYASAPWYGKIAHHGLRGLGRGVGSLFGQGNLGESGGAAISKFFGWGKYKRSRISGVGEYGYGGDAGGNQIMEGSVETPVTVNTSDDLTGDVYISHREFLGNVATTGGSGNITPFTLQKFAINPGLSTSFPWLSQIAQNYELYELIGTVFEYRPLAGELGATGTNSLGKVVMVTNYDPDAADFLSTVQMENYDYANACKPSERMLHGVETARCQRLTNMLYIRTGNSPKDLVLTDVGNFYLATEGLPVTSGTTAIIGELWVTYRVKLSRAQLYQGIGAGQKLDVFFGANSAGNLGANSVSYGLTQSIAPYYNFVGVPANGFVPALVNSIGCTAVGNAANSFVLTFPRAVSAGVYRIIVSAADFNGRATYWQNPTSLTNCVGAILAPLGFGGANLPEQVSTGTTVWTGQFQDIRINAPGNLQASLVFANQVNNYNVNTSIWVQVIQMPQNFYI